MGVGIGQKNGTIDLREKGFQKKRSGHLIDEVFAVKAVAAGAAGATNIQQGMCFASGKAFVEEVMRELRVLGKERVGEGAGLGRLGAGGAVGVKRVADDERGNCVEAYEAGDGLQVRAQAGAMNGKQRMRREVQGIGYGEADATVADVQRKDATCVH